MDRRLTLAAWLLLGCGTAEPRAGGDAPGSSVAPGRLASATPTGSAPAPAGASPASASASASATPAPGALAPARRRVAAMGDSLTDPKSHGGIYLEVLRERCPKSAFTSFGVGGNMVNMMRKRFLRDVYGGDELPAPGAPPRFTDLILLGGLGDILSNETAGRNERSIARDLSAMVELAHARGARVIVMTLPPWGEFKGYDGERARITGAVNDWLREERRADRFEGLLETGPILSCGDPQKLCRENAFKDRIHWSEQGQRKVGEALYASFFRGCE